MEEKMEGTLIPGDNEIETHGHHWALLFFFLFAAPAWAHHFETGLEGSSSARLSDESAPVPKAKLRAEALREATRKCHELLGKEAAVTAREELKISDSPVKAGRLVHGHLQVSCHLESKEPESVLRALALKLGGELGLQAAEILKGEGENCAVALIWATKKGNAVAKTRALELMAQLHLSTKEVVAAVLQRLTDSEEDVQNEAAQTLKEIKAKPEETLDTLIKLLSAANGRTRYLAGWLIETYGLAASKAKDALLQIYEKFPLEWSEFDRVIMAIGGVDEKDLPRLLNLIKKDMHSFAKGSIIRLLIGFGSKANSAVPDLFKIIQRKKLDTFFSDFDEAIKALGALGPVQDEKINALVLERLKEIAKNSDDEYPPYVIEAAEQSIKDLEIDQ